VAGFDAVEYLSFRLYPSKAVNNARAETEKVDYGLVAPLKSCNPIAVHFHVFGKLLRALKKTGSARARFALLLGKPAVTRSD